MKAGIGRIAESLWRLAYPEQCLACGSAPGHRPAPPVRAPCRTALPWIGPDACPRCGEAVAPHAATDGGCAACRTRPYAFRRATSPFRYDGVIRDMILAFKLGRKQHTGHVLGHLLCDFLAADGVSQAVNLVVPVPLHWWRRVQRGFNQAAILSQAIGERFGLPVALGVLRRRRLHGEPDPSARPRAGGERPRAPSPRVSGQCPAGFSSGSSPAGPERSTSLAGGVLLVDNVFTTGATAHECARALREVGSRNYRTSFFRR